MLRGYISVSDDLVNGAMEITKKVKWVALREEQIEGGKLLDCVSIKCHVETTGSGMNDEDGCVAIRPAVAILQLLHETVTWSAECYP